MAFDEGLAERVRILLQNQNEVQEKKMFGGLCFMVSNHMCCGIVGENLMARVGPQNYETCLSRKFVSEMDFTGRPMKGMVYVTSEGISEDEDLSNWLNLCLEFINSLPPKI